jgi:hypothetical protein
MDYSKQVQSSRQADLAYAQWYAQLPDEKKAAIFLNGFNFVADKIKFDTLQDNPFATKAEITWRFIEYTQKDSYPPDVFDFMRKKMMERAEQEWKDRFKTMKKSLNWTYDEMAQYMGAQSGGSLKASVNRKLPAFAKLAVCIFEKMKEKLEENSPSLRQ